MPPIVATQLQRFACSTLLPRSLLSSLATSYRSELLAHHLDQHSCSFVAIFAPWEAQRDLGR